MRLFCAANFLDERPQVAADIADALSIDYLLFSYFGDVWRATDGDRLPERSVPAETEAFRQAVALLAPALFLQPQLRLLADAGGGDPRKCAQALGQELCGRGCAELEIAVVLGDNLLDRLEELTLAGCGLDNEVTGKKLTDISQPLAFAQCRMGAEGIMTALAQGARIIVAGGTSLSTLAVAAARHHHQWSGSAYDLLAVVAAVAQLWETNSATSRALHASGKEGTVLRSPPQLSVELNDSGTATIQWTGTTESAQLCRAIDHDLQTISDTPDVVVDTTNATISPDTADARAITISSVKGRSPSETRDVRIGILDGYETLALLHIDATNQVIGPDEIVRVLDSRLNDRNVRSRQMQCERLTNDLYVLRGMCHDKTTGQRLAEEIEWLRKVAHLELVDMPSYPETEVGPSIRTWQARLPREMVETSVDCRPANDWV